MWELPGAQVHETETPAEIAKEIAAALTNFAGGARVGDPVHLEPVDHAFTHLRVRYVPFVLLVPFEGDGPTRREDVRWVDPGEADELPIPSAQLQVLSQIF